MNLWFRLLSVLLRNAIHARPRLESGDEAFAYFHVWPNDLDTNLHMNNGRYFTLMDLGRLDFMAQLGMLWPSFRLGLLPVLGSSQMVFLKPLFVGQRFAIGTRLVHWDDKWFVMQQRFVQGDTTVAKATVRGIFRRNGKTISPAAALKLCGGQLPPIETPPPEVAEWLASLAKQRTLSADATVGTSSHSGMPPATTGKS